MGPKLSLHCVVQTPGEELTNSGGQVCVLDCVVVDPVLDCDGADDGIKPEVGTETNIVVQDVGSNLCLTAVKNTKRVVVMVPQPPRTAYLPDTTMTQKPVNVLSWTPCSSALLTGGPAPADQQDPYYAQSFKAFWDTESTNLGVPNTTLKPQSFSPDAVCVTTDTLNATPGLNTLSMECGNEESLVNQWNPRTLASINAASQSKFVCIGPNGYLVGEGSTTNPRCTATVSFRPSLYKPNPTNNIPVPATFFIRDTRQPNSFLTAVPPPFISNMTSAMFLQFNGSPQQQWSIEPLPEQQQPTDGKKQYQTFAQILLANTQFALRAPSTGVQASVAPVTGSLDEQFSIPLLQIADGSMHFLGTRPLVVMYSGSSESVVMEASSTTLPASSVKCDAAGKCYAEELPIVDNAYEFVPTSLWPIEFTGPTLQLNPVSSNTVQFTGTGFAPYVVISQYTVNGIVQQFQNNFSANIFGTIVGTIPTPPRPSFVQIGQVTVTF